MRDALLSRSRTVGKRKSLMCHKPNKVVQTSIALTELARYNEERTSAIRRMEGDFRKLGLSDTRKDVHTARGGDQRVTLTQVSMHVSMQ